MKYCSKVKNWEHHLNHRVGFLNKNITDFSVEYFIRQPDGQRTTCRIEKMVTRNPPVPRTKNIPMFKSVHCLTKFRESAHI